MERDIAIDIKIIEHHFEITTEKEATDIEDKDQKNLTYTTLARLVDLCLDLESLCFFYTLRVADVSQISLAAF